MQPSLLTKVGATTDVRAGADVVLVHEPDTGATLRTKGRFFFLCEVAPPDAAGSQVAREIAELARDEYFYDLSAGIEVSLRKALRNANRRAAQRLRESRSRAELHCACAIVVNSEAYAARIGAAQVFLVRRARLFLPGDQPGELADFVHRTTTREAASLGAEPDLLPTVWRQRVEPGDTLIIASGGLVHGLGAEALKSAAVTLHPRAAAEHVHNRFVAEGASGSDAGIFVELAPVVGALQRVAASPEPPGPPAEVVIAETIRDRLDRIWRRRPRVAAGAIRRPVTVALGRAAAVTGELLPRRAAPALRTSETALRRSARQRRIAATAAIVLLAVALATGGAALRDYQVGEDTRGYAASIGSIEAEIAEAERLAGEAQGDGARARDLIASANSRLDGLAESPAADPSAIDALRARTAQLIDRLFGVYLDLAEGDPAAAPTSIAGTANGLYASDPGSGLVWRIFGDPAQAGVVARVAPSGLGSPVTVAALDAAVFTLDEPGRLWRAEGNTFVDVTPADAATRWSTASDAALFFGNLYVLDPRTGQVWKHEPGASGFTDGIAFLREALPTDSLHALAVDGDVWLLTTSGELMRYRRGPLTTTAARVDFTPRWSGSAIRPSAIQALDTQASIYLLDGASRLVVQMSRDGTEVARYALPEALPEAGAFYVSETERAAYTIHGAKIVRTGLRR